MTVLTKILIGDILIKSYDFVDNHFYDTEDNDRYK